MDWIVLRIAPFGRKKESEADGTSVRMQEGWRRLILTKSLGVPVEDQVPSADGLGVTLH